MYDGKYECNDQQFATLLRNVYVSNKMVNFNKADDLYNSFMLITALCGRGKTTYALDIGEGGMLYDINAKRNRDNLFDRNLTDIQPNECLFLSSRTNIVKQTLSTNHNAIEATEADFTGDNNWFREQDTNGKFLVATAHKFGEWIKEGKVKKTPKLIIVDELHSILGEHKFAESLSYVIEYLEEHYDEIIKIGLTATPQFLNTYIENNCDTKFKFQVVDCGEKVGAKYKANKVKVLVGGKGKTVLNEYNNKIDSNHKAIYYIQSAKQCYQLAKEYGDKAGFIISQWNDTATNEDGELLSEIMKQQGIRDYILNNEKLPDDKNLIFMNASCREGMNIKDENVKYIFCESPDLITIEQVLGRIRNNTEEFIVIVNFNNYRLNESNIQDLLDFLKQYEENPTTAMARRQGRQEENKKLQKLVYQYKGESKINRFAKAYLQYIQESYIQVSNRCDKKYISQVGDRKMLMTEEYFKQLEKYAVNGKVEIQEVITATIEKNHENAIDRFRQIENEWLNKPIGKEEKKKLCGELSVVRSNGNGHKTVAGWTTIKQMLIDNGYSVQDKRIGKERKSVSIIIK